VNAGKTAIAEFEGFFPYNQRKKQGKSEVMAGLIGKMMSTVLDSVRLKSLWYIQVRCLQAVGFMGLEHLRDIWAGDIDKEVISIGGSQ
jgi:hypothetical protein